MKNALDRFSMIKKRHANTLEKAIAEQKADHAMIPLCRFVASTRHYFTSSSCAGRILLLELPDGENKKDSRFHRKWHSTTTTEKIREGLLAKTTGELWLKVDPFILHIGCADLEHAQTVLKAMKEAGIKRGGIMVAQNGKFMIEFQGSQGLAVPVKKDDRVLVNDEHLDYLIVRANQKVSKNYAQLEALEKILRNRLD